MKYNFETEKGYLAPVCKVYSIMIESVIAGSPNSACDNYEDNPLDDLE